MKKLLTAFVLLAVALTAQASTATRVHSTLQGFFPPGCLLGHTLVTLYDANGRTTGGENVRALAPLFQGRAESNHSGKE